MNISHWTLYLCEICNFIWPTSVTLFGLFFIFSIMILTHPEGIFRRKGRNICIIAALIFLLLAIFVPSTDACYRMVIVPTLKSKEDIKALPQYLQDALYMI